MAAQTLSPDFLSPNDSLATESEWSDLPPAENDAPESTPPDVVGLLTVEPGHCAACGEFIVREPGARGRAPKYHPDCRPAKSSRAGAGAPRRSGADAKRESESDLAISLLEPYVMQLAMMLSFVDQYDAYTVLSGWPGIRDNLRGLMIRYDWLRGEILAISTGGSILGLVLSILMIALPICAHHGIIKGKRVAPILERAPFMLSQMQARLDQGVSSVKDFLESELLSKSQQRNGQNGGPK